MAIGLEALTDARGRITGYSFAAHYTRKVASPENIAEYLDGGERVTVSGIEYDLDEDGNLIHPDVELHDDVYLGYGVLLGAGVRFEEPGLESGERYTEIGDHALIRSAGEQHIGLGAFFGHHSIFRGNRIGRNATVGSYVRVGEDSSIGSHANIGNNVKIQRRVRVGSAVKIGYNAKVGDEVHIEPDIDVGHSAKILPTGTGRGGLSIRVAEDVAPHATVVHNVVSH